MEVRVGVLRLPAGTGSVGWGCGVPRRAQGTLRRIESGMYCVGSSWRPENRHSTFPLRVDGLCKGLIGGACAVGVLAVSFCPALEFAALAPVEVG